MESGYQINLTTDGHIISYIFKSSIDKSNNLFLLFIDDKFAHILTIDVLLFNDRFNSKNVNYLGCLFIDIS